MRDQPHDIQRQIQDIPMFHICAKSHNLVVIGANAQLADSDGLKMVIEPEGEYVMFTATCLSTPNRDLCSVKLGPTPNVDVISCEQQHARTASHD
ncbi:hypothetical protein BS47DRAFT_1385375, partial [Hydnum rufescens UP504]